METIGKIAKALLDGSMCTEDVSTCDELESLMHDIHTYKHKLRVGRTATLWLQYLQMVEILFRLIKSERTGNGSLHLQSLRDMLPFFASTGHNSYAKSSHIYLTKMNELPNSHPQLHRRFMDGYHVVRRSDRFWSGLSTDLVIEQTLMKGMKISGGLTRGKGVDEEQRSEWILSRPICSIYSEQMVELSGVLGSSRDEHVEMSEARRKKDTEDVTLVEDYLDELEPFSTEQDLKSIASGVVADKNVNVEEAQKLGELIIAKMEGVKIDKYVFK